MAEKILVVDDDLDTLRLVGMMLERQGYTIVAASNGNQAISMAQSEYPDLILLDVMMPDIDGVEVTRRLRSDDVTKDVPIIMFTAKTQVEDKILGFEAGADDYLTKPTQPRELFAHVKAVLARTAKARPAAPTTQAVAQVSERGYVVGILAVRGGLGVSTLSLNLGVALHEAYNKEVIVSEFRPGKGTISLELGYSRPEGLVHLLQKKPSEIDANAVDSELTLHSPGFRLLLASPQPRDAKYINSIENFEAITRQLMYLGKYIVLDLGTSLTPLAEKVIPLCDEIIVAVEPVPQTLAQTKALLDDLIGMGIGSGRISVVVVNRSRSGMQLSWSQVQEQLGRNIAVIFTPAPELAYQASTNNAPMILQQPESLTAQQFTKLAELVAQRK
jgi:CheY-like chemotaxis protein/MinD-like ATPase involved in chromosome partitioning or flagellar assembly